MEIIIKSKFEKGDSIFLQAYGIGSYREVTVLEVAATRDNKSFIYRVLAHNCFDQYNWIPEEHIYETLYALQEKWRKDILSPTKY